LDHLVEVQEAEPRNAAMHVDVLVDDRVYRIPPTAIVLVDEAAADPGGEQFDVALGERLGDGPFVGEELVNRADRDTRALGDPRGGQGFIAAFVEQFGAGVEHTLHTPRATALGWPPP